MTLMSLSCPGVFFVSVLVFFAFLMCFDVYFLVAAVSLVVRTGTINCLQRLVFRYDPLCLEWDVKDCSISQSFQCHREPE